ncbi:uncharacterized protein LOC115663699 [Syzygium oleosum]|uniref:uncharacterized protein LOC115663699 n=1 Tax=Syzygium oleosum TaxID=219896 RepID=UPI0011D275D0|nr:uncharacterized protein LOC115663699 [Syzygium oleosum]
MAFKWLLSSAFIQVLGIAEETVEEKEKGKANNGCSNGRRTRDQAQRSGKADSKDRAEELASATRFQMPLHYPRYTKADYEKMEEWRLDLLLQEYGMNCQCQGSLDEKRAFAIGAFLWPDQR